MQRRLSRTTGPRLRALLAAEHRRVPFSPSDPRDAARRVLRVAADLGLDGHIVRGGLDLGGAELEHLWAVVERRVVDVVLPVRATRFVTMLRGYVAGDVSTADLTQAAAEYELEWRVVGDVPSGCRYLGEPVLAYRSTALVRRESVSRDQPRGA